MNNSVTFLIERFCKLKKKDLYFFFTNESG